MFESEQWIRDNDPNEERLYYASGIALISCIKGLMSFEDKDLAQAIAAVKHGAAVAQQHRKAVPFASRIVGLVGMGNPVAFVKGMSDVQRHAELVYAECLLEKAVVGIVYSGDWLQFIREALNMRTATGIYRTLLAYLAAADAAGEPVDAHFRSGVMLGVGLTSLVLSLMPSRVLTIIELFGYKGDRFDALSTLMKPGAWTADTPTLPEAAAEGVRRPICDMALLIFHLVLGGFTVQGIDLSVAETILKFNLERFPTGVFFLFGAGRIALCRSQPAAASAAYSRALAAQSQYPQLHYLAYWELAVCELARWRVTESLTYWRLLREKATWSRACYAYGQAACLLQMGGEAEKAEATKILETIPSLLNRIGGKSIPVEKFVARKARKFASQGRLILPAVELAYFFGALSHAPAHTLRARILPVIDSALSEIDAAKKDGEKKSDKEKKWDDVCLAVFLRAVALRYIAYPDPDARPDDAEEHDAPEAEPETSHLTPEEASTQAKAAFERVLELGSKIEWEHWLVYYTHYELGRLLACSGDKAGAHTHLDIVGSGKRLEASAAARKGKYSMESAIAPHRLLVDVLLVDAFHALSAGLVFAPSATLFFPKRTTHGSFGAPGHALTHALWKR
ncbi:hypothetical protein AURDEDRAFT_143769 [Auricularia subglabra TFB-10046 SS5]|nr:hypothetical protein AURDEDRAFT_143769 [Auricularia subglabra TFB-10046 SS5]